MDNYELIKCLPKEAVIWKNNLGVFTRMTDGFTRTSSNVYYKLSKEYTDEELKAVVRNLNDVYNLR